jgi:hypothetical protein
MRSTIRSCIVALLAVLMAGSARAQTTNCPADLNFDRWTDSADLSQLLLDFGDCFECPADLDGDGVVNGGDVSLMLLDFGPCPDGPSDNPCPPWGTLVGFGGPEDILYNDLVVGVRWWDELSTGWQRFTSSFPEGECPTFRSNQQSECYEYGTVLKVDGEFTYYADGNCAYYTGPTTPPNPCPTAKTIVRIDREYALTVTPIEGGCTETYEVGRATRILYHNGNCGTYWGLPIFPQHKPFGLFLGACGTWEFFSDGMGGYFTIRNCPTAGIVLAELSRVPVTVTVSPDFIWTVGERVTVLETDGECGERENTVFVWLPYGTILGSDGIYDYYSDGNGWYYTVPTGCPISGTLLSSTSTDLFINVIGVEWKIGAIVTTTLADGDCGSYDSTSTEYLPYGALLGSDGTYNYYSDGAGGYYTQQCLSAGTVYYSFSTPITVSVDPAGSWTVGSTTKTVYADGVCGTYEETTTDFVSYGTFLGSYGGSDYYSDGAGGYYTEPTGCPPAGTVLTTSSEPIMVSVPSGAEWQVGTIDTTVYADGACGSTPQSNQNYLSYGTFLGSDGTCDYYSNGAGGYYTSNC